MLIGKISGVEMSQISLGFAEISKNSLSSFKGKF